MPAPNNWILGVKGSLGNPESLRTRIAKSLLLGGSMFSIVNCLRTVRQQFDPRRQKFRSSKFNLFDRQQMANKQFGPAANVHIDRPHQIINSAKVVINSTNSSLGHWRQDVSWIGNNLSLGGKASFEIMIRSSDPVIE